MITMQPVVEVTWSDVVALSGRMTREEFDVVVGPDLVDELLHEEMVILAGGVRVSDTSTGLRIEPGCCFGLENWRDWAGVLDGEVSWLGHSPAPGVERADGVLRLWRDESRRDEPACEFPLADLPGHLEGVRQDLIAFLGLLRAWAPDGLGERLAAAFDHHFHVSPPL
ncbi:hypothetical protein ACFWN2_09230 [Lentzea sp. NPDC058436]|uniref:hypothetical protein n=1 Tax=Lentzea sp. NPDC058436 TaxID=3346499 RepID=UPI003659DBE7